MDVIRLAHDSSARSAVVDSALQSSCGSYLNEKKQKITARGNQYWGIEKNMKEDKFLDFIMRKKWGCFEKNF
jgi:hypothetical protein